MNLDSTKHHNNMLKLFSISLILFGYSLNG